jgi:predicted CxxxxCH...CXXCH cytochrome family protein
VGAHQAHVTDTALHQAYACDVCHITPTAYTDAGHLGAAPAEITFGDLAKGDLRNTPANMVATWNTTSLTCQSVYCHALPGAASLSPSWTGSQTMGCGSCHGMPPSLGLAGYNHKSVTIDQCYMCHLGVNQAGTAITDITTHANGVVDMTDSQPCCDCHTEICGP